MRWYYSIALSLTVTLIGVQARSEDEPKPRLLVFDVIPSPRLASLVAQRAALTNVLMSAIGKTGAFQVIDLAARDSLFAQKKMEKKDCDKSECRFAMARAVQIAEQILEATIEPLGQACLVTIKRQDVRKGTALATETREGVACDPEAVVIVLKELIGGSAAATGGAMIAGVKLNLASVPAIQTNSQGLANFPAVAPTLGRLDAVPVTVQAGANPDADGSRVVSNRMVQVPGGEFWRGCHSKDTSCSGDDKPGRIVYVSAYRIDKTEVTVGAYTACVKSGQCTAADTGPYCNYLGVGKENHPINCVDWSQAKVYCESQGKSLPTEAQWEKAARGTDGRIFPWGNQTLSCEFAVWSEGGHGCGKNSTWPVGSKLRGASPYGALDMAGNVWEWTLDWYDVAAYSKDSRDPKGPLSGSSRVYRGGSFFYVPPAYLRAGYRSVNRPSSREFGVGFRCVE